MQIGDEGLLAKDMLARLERRLNQRPAVLGVGGKVKDGDVIPGQKGRVIRHHLGFRAELGRARLGLGAVARQDGGHLNSMRLVGIQMGK